jgi:hypothetical protein
LAKRLRHFLKQRIDLVGLDKAISTLRANIGTPSAIIGTLRAIIGTLHAIIGTRSAIIGTLNAIIGTAIRTISMGSTWSTLIKPVRSTSNVNHSRLYSRPWNIESADFSWSASCSRNQPL